MPGRERAKYLYRIARLLQDRAREFAVAFFGTKSAHDDEPRASANGWLQSSE